MKLKTERPDGTRRELKDVRDDPTWGDVVAVERHYDINNRLLCVINHRGCYEDILLHFIGVTSRGVTEIMSSIS